MSISTKRVLLGDIGATNARFAILTDDTLEPVTSVEVADFARFADAVATFLKENRHQVQLTHALFAVAAPVEGERCTLTNASWVIDTQELQEAFNLQARIVNDFEAVALSLPLLAAADVTAIGSGKPEPGAPMAVLGPGTGLGVACLIASSKGPMIIPSEGGHATLASTCEREDGIIRQLRHRFGHVSAERAISGNGLENIYQAIAELDGSDVGRRSAAEITTQALRGECQIAHEALHTFCGFLGSFAGNVALTFRARGGIYLAGGISPRILDFMARSEFRNRFEAKGRFRSYLEVLPSYVIIHPEAAFLGLKALADSGDRR